METTTSKAVTEVAKTTGIIARIIQWFSKPQLTIKQVDSDIYAIESAIKIAEKYPGWNISYEDGKLNFSECTNEELVARASNRMLAEAIRKESNRERVLMLAINEAQQSNNNISEKSVDEDWLTRFFHIVEDVSSENMQIVWSKILAGEIIRPGRFSLRTLETIRNVSKVEAEIFQTIIPLVLKSSSTIFITSDDDILKKNDINYEMILRLAECGLVNPNSLLTLTLTVTDCNYATVLNDKSLIKIEGKNSTPFKLSHSIYALTKAGEELYAILEHKYDEKYMFDLAEKIYTDSKDNITVSVNKIIGYTDDGKIICNHLHSF